MKGLLIGDYKELFSKEQFIDLASQYGFKDIDQSYSATNELYTFYNMYLKDMMGCLEKALKRLIRLFQGIQKS